MVWILKWVLNNVIQCFWLINCCINVNNFFLFLLGYPKQCKRIKNIGSISNCQFKRQIKAQLVVSYI